MKYVVIGAAILLMAALTISHAPAADCSAMRAYAQRSANDMAQRDAMGNHDYFHAHPHIGAENIGWWYKTEAAMMAVWWKSPPHAANMRLPYPCKVVAHAKSHSGRLYWALEVGN